jgi:hypothetical protein
LQEDDFSAMTQGEKMDQRNREDELRLQIEILAVEIDDIGAAINESLATEFCEVLTTDFCWLGQGDRVLLGADDRTGLALDNAVRRLLATGTCRSSVAVGMRMARGCSSGWCNR